MTMVLVHGGGLGKECWDPLLPFLEGEVLAVDLPGRGNRPADLSKVGIADFVAAVVDDLESRDLHDVVLVGHSLAGLTIPQVAARVPDRIRALVFLSCTVPRDGQSTYDTLDPEIQAISDQQPDEAGSGDALNTLDPELATAVFYNDVTDPQVLEWGLSILVPEAPATVTDPMVLATMPRDIRRVWIRLTDDVIVPPEKQNRFIENLGGCEVIDLDSGHMAMISRPQDLAALLSTI
jgi:pimeloyl-ACP methyl ester carboxylesterase